MEARNHKFSLTSLSQGARKDGIASGDSRSESLPLLFFSFLSFFIYIYIKYDFVCLFFAVLGLCCYTRAFSNCGEWGLLFSVQASRCSGFSRCRAWTLGLRLP